MTTNEILTAIFKRRSIRKFKDTDIPGVLVGKILDAARWAPSGLNNQPWRFSVIKEKAIKDKLSGLTKYGRIVKKSNTCISVFYHTPSGYSRDKDLMSIGAAIENMLLTAESLEIGAVWLGEILNQKEDVNTLLGIDPDNELMAVIALGYPNEAPSKDRKELESLMLKSYY
ncbi:MAG: nitroreductase family protein [bacterium]|nr:nitroreductase family protein [bacterium]